MLFQFTLTVAKVQYKLIHDRYERFGIVCYQEFDRQAFAQPTHPGLIRLGLASTIISKSSEAPLKI